MEKSLHQFTLRGLLWAMFWAGCTCGAWTTALRADAERFPAPLRIAAAVLMLVGPCITVGALYRRAALGAAIGLVVVGLAIGGLMLFLR